MFSVVFEGSVAVVHISGSILGDAQARQLIESTDKLLEQSFREFIFNLQELRHMSSAGLGVFITILSHIRSRDGEMILTHLNDTVQNLLTITKLTTIFKTLETDAEAITFFMALREGSED
jgi:anti-anti-sigma factor